MEYKVLAKIVGIDLGTSNSVIACKTTTTEILPNDQGDLLTPSCVYFNPQLEDPLAPDATLVGKAALNWQKQEPSSVVVSIKRLMRRSLDDENVQKIITSSKLGYSIVALTEGTENSLAISVPCKHNTQQLSPEVISSIILKNLTNNSEDYLQDSINAAIITVPAYFNDKQKHATQIAANKAGLQVLRLLPELTAAAIAFGITDLEGQGTSTVLVYDFGGGTLDISILTIGGSNIIEHGKTGDMWLGDNDIDESIIALIFAHANQELDTPLETLIQSKDALEQKRIQLELLAQAEQAKIKLRACNKIS